MHAGLARHRRAQPPVELDEPERVRVRAVGEVQARARPVGEVQQLGRGSGLRDRRMGLAVRERVVLAAVAQRPEAVLDHLLQLVVDDDGDPGAREHLERRQQVAVRDPGEPARVVLEQRELERAHAALDELGQHAHAVDLGHRPVEADVDDRPLGDLADLLVEPLAPHDGLGAVVGHVDDRRHPAVRRARRRAREVLGLEAARVDVRVDDARHQPAAREVVDLRRVGKRRRRDPGRPRSVLR